MSKSIIHEFVQELSEKEQLALSVLSVPTFLTNDLAREILIKTEVTNGDTENIIDNLLSYPIWIRKSRKTWSIDDDIREVSLKKLNGSTEKTRVKVLDTFNKNKQAITALITSEQIDFDFQVARLSLTVSQEREKGVNIFRTYFEIAENFNNKSTSKIVSDYIDENIGSFDETGNLNASTLSVFYMRGMQAYRDKDTKLALKYLLPVWEKHYNTYQSIKDAAISAHIVGLIYSKNRNRSNDAENAYKDSLNLLEQINDKYGLAQVYHSLGNLYSKNRNRSNDAEKAYKESLKIGEEINHTAHLAQVYHSLGNLYSKNRNRSNDAEKAYKESLRLEEINNNKHGLAQVYHSLGNLYSKNRNRLKDAEKEYRKSIEIRPSDDQDGFAQVYNSLGDLLSKMKRYKEAESAYKESIKIGKKINKEYHLAKVYHSFANMLRRISRFNEAEILYKDSLAILHKINDKKGLAQVYMNYGILKKDMNEFNKSSELLNKALEYERIPFYQQKIMDILREIR